MSEEIKVETPKPVPMIAVNQVSQLIVARDQSELWRMIQMFMKGSAFPKTIDTPEKAIAAWQMAASLNLPPMVVIQNLAFVHGSISMWGSLPKALVDRTGQLEEYRVTLFDDAQKVITLANKNLEAPVWGSAIQMRRLKRSKNEYYFTEPEAKAAGLLGKSGPWQQYRKIMYTRRASGQACKFEFPDSLMAVPVAEYDHNVAPDLWKDVSPKSNTLADQLNEEFLQCDNNAKPAEPSEPSTAPTCDQ